MPPIAANPAQISQNNIKGKLYSMLILSDRCCCSIKNGQ